jgi:hypothetical protein
LKLETVILVRISKPWSSSFHSNQPAPAYVRQFESAGAESSRALPIIRILFVSNYTLVGVRGNDYK